MPKVNEAYISEKKQVILDATFRICMKAGISGDDEGCD